MRRWLPSQSGSAWTRLRRLTTGTSGLCARVTSRRSRCCLRLSRDRQRSANSPQEVHLRTATAILVQSSTIDVCAGQRPFSTVFEHIQRHPKTPLFDPLQCLTRQDVGMARRSMFVQQKTGYDTDQGPMWDRLGRLQQVMEKRRASAVGFCAGSKASKATFTTLRPASGSGYLGPSGTVRTPATDRETRQSMRMRARFTKLS